MRGPFIGLGLGRGSGNVAPFRITVTGLSEDSLGLYAQIGNHAAIGFTSTCVPLDPTVFAAGIYEEGIFA